MVRGPGWMIVVATALAIAAGWNLSAEPYPGSSPSIPAHRPAASSQGTGPAPGLITQVLASGTAHERVMVVDPTTRVLSVYRIARENGAITLESVRNVNWDLQLMHYNSQQPTPQEVRAGLERG